MFPNWLKSILALIPGAFCLISNLRMHCSENVGDYQSTCSGVGIELDVFALGSSTDTVKSDCALDCSIDALDGNSNDAPLVV